MSPTEHTLDDLVQATGFSKRQIRFYITRKLVPGAGDSRGPHATYGEETLRRLLLIRDLKETPVGPTGRTMTLDEIGHALDAISPDALAGPATFFEEAPAPEGRALLRSMSLERRGPLGSARDYLRRVRETVVGSPPPAEREITRFSMFRGISEPSYSISEQEATPRDDLRDLLGRLQALLAELGSDTRFTPKAGEARPWVRVTTPDVEINVRQPDDHGARARLAALAAALAGLLAREE